MNRIILIGNGFDLSHGLKTSYADFIKWYCDKIIEELKNTRSNIFKNLFIEIASSPNRWLIDLFGNSIIEEKQTGYMTLMSIIKNEYQTFNKITLSPFFENIITSIESKKWVDIENGYYLLLKRFAIDNNDSEAHSLNIQLYYLQELLIKYLNEIKSQEYQIKENIWKAIYGPINPIDIAVDATETWNSYIKSLSTTHLNIWRNKLDNYGISDELKIEYLSDLDNYKIDPKSFPKPPAIFRLPDNIMLLNFNYTNTAFHYLRPDNNSFTINQIHGQLEKTATVIFGYGDEMDDQFKQIQNLNNPDYLKNVKSINYLNSSNYRKVLTFIKSSPFQIYIMGHSCGNSDRTLLHTLFEHENCISIKPYYHVYGDGTDNYIEIVQNISRNFYNMALMRDRVVNKTYCESMD